MKTRMIPCAFVMAVCCIKDSSLTVLFYPRPWFMMVFFHTFHQHCNIIAKFIVYVSFIPCRKFLQRLDYGMIFFYDLYCKSIGLVFEKLTTYKTDIVGRILKTKTCAMYRNKAFSFFHKTQQSFFLFGRNLFMICINH